MNRAELKNYHKQKDSAELIKAQKAATDHLMSTLSHLPWTREAVVAGGAPREWYRQQPASDIDIFLIGTTITKTQLEFTLREAGFDVKEAARGDRYSDSDDYGYRNPGIKWVYDGHIDWRSSVLSGAHRIKYQVIVTEFQDLSKLLGSFPVEISKFTWNHVTKKINGEPGALKDMADKTVTKTAFDYKRGKYVDKILHKFPDHKFVNLFDNANAVATKTKKADHPYRMAAKHPENPPQAMDPTAFVFWLQGFFEMANPTALNELQTTMVKDHLALVFNKLTPNRNGDVFMPRPVQWPANVDEQRRIATEVKGRMLEVKTDQVPEPSVTAPFAIYNGHELVKVSPSYVSPVKTLVSC